MARDPSETRPVLNALVVFGTRPEAIKLAPVVAELRSRVGVAVTVCVTAQHREMLDQVLDLFGMTPEYDLDVMKADQRPEDVSADVLRRTADLCRRLQPDVLLVQGDTTTAMAASLGAFFARIPVGHVEAGLRTGIRTSPFPEEMMRRIVSEVALFHFAPTTRAAENLAREHAHAEGHIFLTGNTVVDAVEWIKRHRPAQQLSFARQAKRLILLTAHRRENFGEPIQSICRAVRTIADRFADIEIVYPVHLNPNVQGPARALLSGHERIHLLPPVTYVELVGLLKEADLVLTDSGGLQEEAPVFGRPVLVLRRDTERPEAIEAGTALLVGTDETAIVRETARLLTDREAYTRMAQAKSPFGDGHAARRIADILMSWRGGELDRVEHLRWREGGTLAPYQALVGVP
ncbi:MAG TPA: UDP-N-acetylglucosamine 2-epimerase (non-hydrolyzing) [Gemmatimonadaceae bacterium]|jgi:UDP-N-acetylglucosamine 2-epimerase